jgi:hypothetical protein
VFQSLKAGNGALQTLRVVFSTNPSSYPSQEDFGFDSENVAELMEDLSEALADVDEVQNLRYDFLISLLTVLAT